MGYSQGLTYTVEVTLGLGGYFRSYQYFSGKFFSPVNTIKIVTQVDGPIA